MRKKAIETTKTWNKDLTIGATLEGRYVKKETFAGKYGETEKLMRMFEDIIFMRKWEYPKLKVKK